MSTLTDNITGFQHLGLPVKDIDQSISFYCGFGFSVSGRHELEEHGGITRVAFLDINGFCLELYQPAPGVADDRTTGIINHIALDVKDIDTVYEEINKAGFRVIEGINTLPLQANGIKFFMISGPDGERVEFNQKL
ncbi:VOC family protein [Marispirochaeta sp.]|jgi:lactoylglutathione lyase|uniref:VOC family protein n=1 Tax=Marispirochaeta sp. TaxID=2038653 RepID=UPI0029C952A9|nr:VOC family protein [Marispirochaeta sp.]